MERPGMVLGTLGGSGGSSGGTRGVPQRKGSPPDIMYMNSYVDVPSNAQDASGKSPKCSQMQAKDTP